MKHTIMKRSAPGWSKDFETEEAARAELLSHICGECLKSEMEQVGFEEKYCFPAPDQNSISSLLSTPCGCEFEYEAAQ